MQLCEAWQRTLRCKEQRTLILQEMDKFMTYYERMRRRNVEEVRLLDECLPAVLSRALFDSQLPSSNFQKLLPGLRALLYRGIRFAEWQLGRAAFSFHGTTKGVFQQGTHYVVESA